MRTLHKIEGPLLIFLVVLLAGIIVFKMIANRHSEIDLAVKRLIEAGRSVDEILQDPDFTRLAAEKDGLPTNPDDWTQDNRYRAMRLISASADKLGYSPAVEQVRQDASQRRSAYFKKKIAVQKVILAAQEAHREGTEPFTIKNSLPAAVRTKVEKEFGEDADAVLLQIEEVFATHDISMRVFESDGGLKAYVNRLVVSQSGTVDE